VDYLFKPISPEISKVEVFVDLFKKTEEVKRQAVQIKMQELQVLSQQHEKLCLHCLRGWLDLPMN